MSKRKFLLLLSALTLISTPNAFLNNFNVNSVKAINGATYQSSLTTNIDLKRNSEGEIREYYSTLSTLSSEKRSGQNLLKNLLPILQNMNYFSYDNVWKIYEITDREWELSPASETTYGTYNSSNETITNYSYGSNSNPKNDPYVKTLYRNKDSNNVTLEEARIKEWGSHTADGTNREHIWCQSRGFKASSGAEGPAGTDLHHLRSGDGYVNQSLHNDNPYGYVDKSNISKDGKDKQTWLSGNYLGKALNTSSKDEADIVFEPQDSDKGDIARAVFYMAAAYNNLDGKATITEFNPNLTIVDYIYDAKSAISSDATTPATMSKLSDLLEWHKLDPVDEFEIYRNDLIYNNYQHNRNPFIDFPSWVDVIWGNEGIIANPSSDTIHEVETLGFNFSIRDTNIEINLNKSDTATIKAYLDTTDTISWSVSNSEILSLDKSTTQSGEEVSIKALQEGTATISVKVIVDGVSKTLTCKVNVVKAFVIETWMYLVAAVIAVIFIIIILSSS